LVNGLIGIELFLKMNFIASGIIALTAIPTPPKNEIANAWGQI
jgi:hypothetical protein